MITENYPHDLYDNMDSGDQDVDKNRLLYGLLFPITYSITCVFGLIGNMLLIIVFMRYEKIKTLTDTFLVNLAIADILFLLTFPFLVYGTVHTWIFGDVMCKIIRASYRINLYTSMLILTSMTFDRFISITKVTKANKYQVTKNKWRYVVCAFLWAQALVLAIPQFLYSKSTDGHCFEVYDVPVVELVVVSLQLTVGFVLPLTSMVICYSFILRTLANARGVQKKKKSMKIIVAIVIVFIVTQTPYNSLVLALVLHKKFFFDKVFTTVSTIMEIIAYSHPCVNPVLYFFVGTKFRKHFWKMLKGLGFHNMAEESSDHLRATDGDSKNVSALTTV